MPAIQLACSTKLRVLDKASDKTDGLAQLLHGTRSIIAQKWKILTVYLSYDKDYPDCERLWSKKEWRKWDVVELLTGLCWKYHQVLLKAKKDGAVLCTQTVDQEYLALVVQILELGVGEAKAIAIKDWERPGTKTTLESRSLLTEDVVTITKKRKRKKKALRATEWLRLFSGV